MSDKSLARLVDLVPYISTHQGIHIRELAKVFEVSVRQIEDDLMTLFMCGYPFYQPMEVHFEGGEVTISNADELARVRKFTKIEIITLLIGLNSLMINDSVLDRLMVKLLSVISPNDTHQKMVDINIFLESITRNEVLEISYLSIDRDEVSKREIVPLDIYADKGFTYLRSFCLLTNAHRTFRVDRILKTILTGKKDSTHIPDNAVNFSGISTVEIKRRRRYVLEYFQSESDEIRFHSHEWFVKSILALAGAVRVRDEISKEEIARRAKQARALYD